MPTHKSSVKKKIRHGHIKYVKGRRTVSLTYSSWRAARDRCYNPKNKDYPLYGERGIHMCDAWDSFELFLEDMGPRPYKKWTLDREDPNGNYDPGNCRWAMAKVQSRNRRCVKLSVQGARSIRAKYKSGKFTQGELAAMWNVDRSTISKVIRGIRW